MQKKLIAVAVAGALGAPAAALAQTSTVQIYGKMTAEYAPYVHQANGRPNTDMFQTPGGSSIGLRGEEKLGGGLSFWFQCESSADVRGLTQEGICSRNSAIGLKGAFGNVHIGKWDLPFKRGMAVGTVGSGETGVSGATFLMNGNSTGTGALGLGGTTAASEEGQNLARGIWKRRETGVIYYESPNFSGFDVLAAYSPANATGVTNATTNAKPRVLSIAGIYRNGPLALSAAYERHNNFAGVGGSNDDRGWTIAGQYTFAGVFKLGAAYVDYNYEMTPTTNLKKKNWTVGAEWNVSGPHNIDAVYVRAGDSKGNSATRIAQGNGPIEASGPDTGAQQWEISYRYAFSKRTYVRLGYVKVDNDNFARYTLGGLAAGVAPGGQNQSAWFMYWDHTY